MHDMWRGVRLCGFYFYINVNAIQEISDAWNIHIPFNGKILEL